MKIIGGFYAGATVASVRASGVKTLLIMPLETGQWVADEFVHDPAYTCILRGDGGKDNDQFDENRPPEEQARAYYDRFLRPSLDRWPGWDVALGPCETWRRLEGDVPQPHLEYRAALESTLCDIVQNERQTAYLLGSIPIGNLEAKDIILFRAVIAKAYGWSAHLYLGPGHTSIDQEDNYYLHRPLRIWLPECKRLGLPFKRLCATEVGTYYPPRQTGLTMDQYARLCVDIVGRLAADFAAAGVEFIGGAPFAYGVVGSMDGWNEDHTSQDIQKSWKMDGTEPIIAAANPERVTISLPGGTVPAPTPTPGGGAMDPDEKLRLGEYGRWSLARLQNNEDPRDVTAFIEHIRRLGHDYQRPEDSGLPTVKVTVSPF